MTAGAIAVTSLKGSEQVVVDNTGSVVITATTQQIAALGASGTPLSAGVAITTVGNGTLTAAALTSGLITRTGPVAAFNDTTATAAQIVAAVPGAFVGQSFPVLIKNGTAFNETLLAGANVTLPSTVIIGPNSVAQYIITLTSLTAVTISHVSTVSLDESPVAQFTTASLSAGTLAAGTITGASFTILTNTGATPGAQVVRTAAQMLADFPQARVGFSYILRIVNTGAGTFTLTADGGATVTLTGTATIAQNVFRDYIVTFNTATTATIQSIGSGVSP